MLNISELVKKHEDKREYWKKKYDVILADCHKKIKYYAKYGYTQCYFQVPQSKFGLPVYDIHECLHYIVMKLKRNGLDLEVLSNKIIHISWGRYVSQEPKYIQTAKQIREAEQMRLLPPPRQVKVPRPPSINTPANAVETFSNMDYFKPNIIPVMNQPANRYMVPQDTIPQRNMSEPILNLGPRPVTTRVAEKIHTPNDNKPKRKYTRKPKEEQIQNVTRDHKSKTNARISFI